MHVEVTTIQTKNNYLLTVISLQGLRAPNNLRKKYHMDYEYDKQFFFFKRNWTDIMC